jgi:hypothetical protein
MLFPGLEQELHLLPCRDLISTALVVQNEIALFLYTSDPTLIPAELLTAQDLFLCQYYQLIHVYIYNMNQIVI